MGTVRKGIAAIPAWRRRVFAPCAFTSHQGIGRKLWPMGQLRIIIIPLCLTLASAASARDLQRFATCTGRLSALMEHQWLMQDPGADRTRAQRDAFADLVASLAPDPSRAMALRIEAKAATAAALQLADFGGQPKLRARVMGQLRSCLRLLPQA